MTSYFDWAEARARKQAPSEVARWDLEDWPDIAVTEGDADEATVEAIRKAIREAADA